MMNRGRFEIMANILAFCAQPRLKTQIMYNASITFYQFETYHSLLSSQGLLEKNSDTYLTTEKGHKFVHAFNQLWSTIEGSSRDKIVVRALSRNGKNRWYAVT